MNESRLFPDVFGMGSRSAKIDRRDTHFLARRDDFRIGNTLVRPSIRTVDGPDGTATTEPRVMQVLTALADAKGDVVTREDLIQECWKGQVVGDDSINRAIKEIRKHARSIGADFVIETIPRIGFRLQATEGESDRAPVPKKEAEPRDPPITRRAVLATASLAAVGAASWLVVGSTDNRAVSELMEKSRDAMRLGTPPQEKLALEYARKATRLAPQRAETWGWLALTLARATEHVIDLPARPITEVDEAASRSLRLDPDNADALAARALAIPYYGDWSAADSRFNAVLKRHPDHLYARDAHSFFLGSVGRMREGARQRLAYIDPSELDANIQYRAVYAYWFLGEVERSDRAAIRGLEMWPQHPGLWFSRLWVLSGTGRIDRALAFLANEAGRPPFPKPMFDTLRLALEAVDGGQDQKTAAAARVMGSVSSNISAVVNAVMLLNLLGTLDEAFALSEAYYLERGPIIAAVEWRPGQPVVPDQRRRKTNMLFTPTAAAMQRDVRFKPLMERMGLADYWREHSVVPDFMQASRA